MKSSIGTFVFRAILVNIASVTLAIICNFITPLHAFAGYLLWTVVFSPIVIGLGCLLIVANSGAE